MKTENVLVVIPYVDDLGLEKHVIDMPTENVSVLIPYFVI